MYLSQAFVANFIKCFAGILSEYFQPCLIDKNVKDNIFCNKSKDQITKLFKDQFLSLLDRNETVLLKSHSKVHLATIEKLIKRICQSGGIKIFIDFVLNNENVYKSFCPDNIESLTESIYIIVDENGCAKLQASTPIENDLSLSSVSEDEIDENIFTPQENKKRVCDIQSSKKIFEEPHPKKIKHNPIKISNSKIRNPFFQNEISVQSDESTFKTEKFTCQSDTQDLIKTVNNNLESLQANLTKLNEVMGRTETSLKLIIDNIEVEKSCGGECNIHCNILSQVNGIKKMKGRKTKPLITKKIIQKSLS